MRAHPRRTLTSVAVSPKVTPGAKLQVKDVMVRAPYSVQSTHLLTIAEKLMREKRIRHLPVFNGKKLVGVLSERQVEKALANADPRTAPVTSARLSTPLTTRQDAPLAELARAMAEAKSDVAIVMENEKAVGVFTTIDALHVLADLLEG